VFKAPDAELTDAAGKTIVHHSVGPNWKHVDGSEVTAKVAAKHDAPKADAIPWLLLTATGQEREYSAASRASSESILKGAWRRVRIPCEAATNGKEARIAYEADYIFYASATK